MSEMHILLASCRELGAKFSPTSDGKLKVQAPAPLPEELLVELRKYKAEVLAALSHPTEPVACNNRSDPSCSPLYSSVDPAYWTQRCNETLATWKRKDWEACQRCGQTAWYEQMGFSLCGICTPREDHSKAIH